MIYFNLYNYNGDPNKVGKELIAPFRVNGLLYDDYDLIHPIIEVQTNAALSAEWTVRNYVAFPEIGTTRYYWIKKRVYTETGRQRIYLELDVLQTYKDAILKATATSTRGKVEDTYLSNRQDVYNVLPTITKQEFPNKLFASDNLIMITLK